MGSFKLIGAGLALAMLIGFAWWGNAKLNRLEQAESELAAAKNKISTYEIQFQNLELARQHDEAALKFVTGKGEEINDELQKIKQANEHAYAENIGGAGDWGDTVCPLALNGLCLPLPASAGGVSGGARSGGLPDSAQRTRDGGQQK